MMTRRSMRWIEYAHATLFFAMLIPLAYAIPTFTDPNGTVVFYMKCLLVAVPVVVTDVVIRRVKSLVTYIAICIVLLAGIGWLTIFAPHYLQQKSYFEAYELCYGVGMLIETLVIESMRFKNRVNASKQRREREDPLAPETAGFLNTPVMSLVWYFAVLYMIGICFDSKSLCDIAFYSAIVYTFLSLVYTHFTTSKTYLERNQRTSGIPKKRLLRISAAMLLGFAALLFIGMIPAVLMAGHRQYTDIRKFFEDVDVAPYKVESDAEYKAPAASGSMGMMELIYDDGQAAEPSESAHVFLWILGFICVLVLVYAIIQMIRQLLKDFRNSLDENGDVVEEIEDEESSFKEDIMKFRQRHGAESEAEKIRRRYRKMIRRHRTDRPAPYESPAEIEEYAGLKDDEQMKQLHKEYEEVRYRCGRTNM